MKKNENIEIFSSSGNVFDDLDLPSTQEDLVKVHIAMEIAATIKKRNLTQSEAAHLAGMDQSKISLITRGRLGGFTMDRLVRVLTLLGRDVDIQISPKVHQVPGRIKVRAA